MTHSEPIQPLPTPQRRGKRTFWLETVVVLFLIASFLGWLRLYQAIFDWKYLIELQIRPAPLYFVVHGLVAGTLSLLTAVLLWFRMRWAPWMGRGTALFLATWYWLDRLLLTKSQISRVDMPFAAVVTVFLIGYVFAILALPGKVGLPGLKGIAK
jgi:hypothetical protein